MELEYPREFRTALSWRITYTSLELAMLLCSFLEYARGDKDYWVLILIALALSFNWIRVLTTRVTFRNDSVARGIRTGEDSAET